tara:strand:+ start:207 stop:521 length:315 start_codon:yes stop_codon:yes gene_type:complete
MSENENKIISAGIAFGVLGLILGAAGAIYSYNEIDLERGCPKMDYLEDNYGAADDEESIASAQQACVSDYDKAVKRAAFLPNLSIVTILFGLLLVNGAKKLKGL